MIAMNAMEINIHFTRSWRQPTYKELEHDPRIKTNITDADILRMQIESALESGNRELFMELSGQLKALEDSNIT